MAWLLVDVIWLQRIWLWIRLLSGKVFWVFWLGGKGSGVETSASWTGGGRESKRKGYKGMDENGYLRYLEIIFLNTETCQDEWSPWSEF